jgi:hypothetical protein
LWKNVVFGTMNATSRWIINNSKKKYLQILIKIKSMILKKKAGNYLDKFFLN